MFFCPFRIEPKACGRPEQPPNSTMTALQGFTVGSTVEYECNDGHLLVGPSQRTCLETGFYDEFPPVCKCKANWLPNLIEWLKCSFQILNVAFLRLYLKDITISSMRRSDILVRLSTNVTKATKWLDARCWPATLTNDGMVHHHVVSPSNARHFLKFIAVVKFSHLTVRCTTHTLN